MRSPLRVLIAVSLVAAACGGSGASSESSSANGPSTTTSLPDSSPALESPGPEGTSADLVELRLANDNRLPVDAALDLFAAAFGPVPGATPERFPSPGAHGHLAVRAVLGHWDELTGEQQEAVLARIGVTGPRLLRAPAVQTPDPAVVAMVDGIKGEIEGRMGVTLSIPITVVMESGEPVPDAEGDVTDAWAYATGGGEHLFSGVAQGCTIHLYPSYVTRYIVAHEVFHCFQYDIVGDVSAVYDAEDWIVEGSAVWVGGAIAGIEEHVEGWFYEWAGHHRSVFALDYAGVGFFYTIQSLGVDPWDVVPRMLGLYGMEAVTATGLDPTTILLHMGTAISRSHTLEPLPVSLTWDFIMEAPSSGERSTARVTPARPMELTVRGGGFAKGHPRWVQLEAGDRVLIVMDGDVGTLEFFGMDPITWTDGHFAREFCLVEGGCRCGVDDAVDPGLEQGSNEFIVVPGEFGSGPMVYTVRMPQEVFTDGVWTGSMTTSWLAISSGTQSGVRTEAVTPFELTVEEGVVTSGSYSVAFAVSMATESGAGEGVMTISGRIQGCGFAPQLVMEVMAFSGTMTIAENTVPFEFTCGEGCGDFTAFVPEGGGTGSSPVGPGGAGVPTVWLPAPSGSSGVLSGTIDSSGYEAAFGGGGFVTSGLEITFEATRAG